jgi:uncharacterized protein with GYD domain
VAKFLVKASYNAQGMASVVEDGVAVRVAGARHLVRGLGGEVEAVYFAFGGSDVFAILDLPDAGSAAAVAALISSTGDFASYETVVLLSPDEVDEGMGRGRAYRATTR